MSPFYIILLTRIYGAALAAQVEPRLQGLLARYRGRFPVPQEASVTERDSVLITYGDQLRQAGRLPLRTLAGFCEARLRGVVSALHILPFYPSSSDDGFSITDYRAVDPALGGWGDVDRLGRSFRLMVDAVINHASAQGGWFRSFLRDEAPYRDYFLTVGDDPDLSQVVRPRTSPLLTEFQTSSGPRRLWTTFSADQVDLDYHDPDVLLEVLDILLMYATRRAQFIRLDAIAYLWKEVGTSCIHLSQTHSIIQLMRAVFDELAPHVRLITETNVPHAENISYFGDGTNEAQLVYNFALPPLVLHTFRTGDARVLSEWASGLNPPSDRTAFFNFLASHDGIGLGPARGILSPADADALVDQTFAHGGLVSYKQETDGSQSPYELNINYFDALSDPSGSEPLALQTDRFMAAQAIMLSLRGVPGIYFHSLFGSRNWIEGVRLGKHNRLINRQKLDLPGLEDDLADPGSLRAQVFGRFSRLLAMRAASPAFHPNGGQKILDFGRGVFAVLRTSPSGDKQVLCLQNVTSRPLSAGSYVFTPYQTLWLEDGKL